METELEQPQRALDVLSTVLIEPYSDEDVEREAAMWEATNGQLLLRPWETMEQFIARAADFKTDIKPLGLQMDPGLAKRELDRLMDGVDDPKKLSKPHQQKINELEQVIGRSKSNFAKMPTRAEVQDNAKKRYADYVREEDFGKRVEMVRAETQRYVVELLIKYERNDTVRDAAKLRLSELEVIGS